MTTKREAIRQRKKQRRDKRRKGNLKYEVPHQSQEIPMAKDKDEDDLTSSDDYEADALEAIRKDDDARGAVLAQLAIVAVIREATFVLAEILDPADGDEDPEDDEADED